MMNLVVWGMEGSGKSSLLNRLKTNIFDPNIEKTLGAGLVQLPNNCSRSKLNIWDLSGHERFDSLFHLYSGGANLFIYCIDLTSRLYAEEHEQRINYIKQRGNDAPIVIVGTKADRVSAKDLLILKETIKFNIITSAKNGEGLERLRTFFTYLLANTQHECITLPPSDELIRRFPWTARPDISSLACDFKSQQWLLLNESFANYAAASQNPEDCFKELALMIRQMIRQNRFCNIQNIVHKSLGKLINPEGVFCKSVIAADWLGKDIDLLSNIPPAERKRIGHNFSHLLVDIKIQRLLEGDTVERRNAAAKNSDVNKLLQKLGSHDARVLLGQDKISSIELYTFINGYYTSPYQRRFPKWVDNDIELQRMCNEFSDEQLILLESIIFPYQDNYDIKFSWISMVIIITTINHTQMIKHCHEAKLFLALLNSCLVRVLIDGGYCSDQIERKIINHNLFLIEKYIVSRICPEHEQNYINFVTPSSLYEASLERSKILKTTLMRAASQGKVWETIILLYGSQIDPNTQYERKKTALHAAAIHAISPPRTSGHFFKTLSQRELCYLALSESEYVDITLMDSTGRTAAQIVRLHQNEEQVGILFGYC